MKIKDIKRDCIHFLGYIPCKPHKDFGVHCIEKNRIICKYYIKNKIRILIIKLGAAGDVIRTTPLLYPLRKKYSNSHLTWITDFPDLVPSRRDNEVGADVVLPFNEKSLLIIKNSVYDVIINLDKDLHACSIIKGKDSVKEKFGYTLKNNKPYPVNDLAIHKFMTGIFDDISKANKKSYLEEIFKICGFEYKKEEYILPNFENDINFDIDKTKKVVGLNTGCGGRWTSRLWPFNYWLELIDLLKANNYEIVLLGGPEEHEKNLEFQSKTNVKYFGVQPLKKFIGLMNQVDIVVTAVTMAMHIAIGLKKQLVLLNNIFNKNEFELYGRGIIIEPEKVCKCYFRPTCINEEYRCIEYIYPEKVFEAVISVSKK